MQSHQPSATTLISATRRRAPWRFRLAVILLTALAGAAGLAQFHTRPTQAHTATPAELHFIHFKEKNGQLRPERFFLQWDAERVGALDTTQVMAGVR